MRVKAGYWDSKTNCRKAASKCKSKSEFYQRFAGAYYAALRHNWMDEFFPDSQTKRGKVFWNYDNCKIEAAKYDSIEDFSKKSSRAYRVCLEKGWLDEFGFADRMRFCKSRKKIWTKEECAEIAKQCKTRKEFLAKKPSAYRYAESQGWLDEICGETNTATKERYRQQASLYKHSYQFKKNAEESYKYCLFRGWLDEFFPDEVKVEEQKPRTISDKTVRRMILDYVEANGSQTRDDIRKIMLTICGQDITSKKWGVGWWNNVSYGTSVFLPSKKDRRYLKPVRSFDSSEVRYDIAKA